MCASELTAYLAAGALIAGRFCGPVQCSAHPTVSQPELGGTGQLARFFPEVQPVPTRVVLSVSAARSATLRDSVCVEFAGAEKAIFSSALPLEFGDVIQLAGQTGGRLEAKVIAVRYQDGRTAVAAQFLNGHFSWVNRP
jgi:hypothetical protein